MPVKPKASVVYEDDNGVYIIRDHSVWRPSPTDYAYTGGALKYYIQMEDRGLSYTGVFSPNDPSDSIINAGSNPSTRIVRKYDQLYVSRPDKVEELWHRHGPVSNPQPYAPYNLQRLRALGWNF